MFIEHLVYVRYSSGALHHLTLTTALVTRRNDHTVETNDFGFPYFLQNYSPMCYKALL